MGIRSGIHNIKSYLTEGIWSENFEELSRMRLRIVKDLQVLMLTIKTFSAQKIGFQAVALAFFCTMAAVPFIAIAFVITGGLGLEGLLRNALITHISNPQAIDTLFSYAENVINTAKSSPVGLVSAIFFAWLVIWMMMCVESVFNNVWKVNKSRNLFKRMTFYLAITCISPFIILVFFSGSIIYSNVLDLLLPDKIAFSYNIKSFLGWAVFAIVSIFTFASMYKFIPNHIVEWRNAVKAALLSGIVFTIMQYLFLETQIFVSRLNTIYGAVAAIPLFMFWLNFGWFIILFGAELSYAFQNVNSYNLDRK